MEERGAPMSVADLLDQVVVPVLREGSPAEREGLAGELDRAHQALPPEGAVIAPLLNALVRLLRGESAQTLWAGLDANAQQVFGAVLNAVESGQPMFDESEMAEAQFAQMMEQIANAVVGVLLQGTLTERMQLERQLAEMQAQAPVELGGLSGFLTVTRGMLRGEDVSAGVALLEEPWKSLHHEMATALTSAMFR
jgi:hypothetical protein